MIVPFASAPFGRSALLGMIALCSATAAVAQSAPADIAPLRVETAEQAITLPPPLLVQPIMLDNSARLTLPVSIAGQGPYGFIVDTGSERTVLSRQLAARLGLVNAGTARVVGMAQAVTADLYHVDAIGLRDLSLGSSIVPVFDQSDIGGPGLIGIDALENHRLVIDFLAGQMDIRASEPTRSRRHDPEFDRDAIIVTARRVAGRMILSSARIGGRRVDIILDTGAQSSIGNMALQRLVLREQRQPRASLIPGEIRAVTGHRLDVQHGRINSITIAGVDMNDLPVSFADSPAFAVLGLVERPALLLGMDALSLFDRVAIDFTNRRVVFDLPRGANRRSGARFADAAVGAGRMTLPGS